MKTLLIGWTTIEMKADAERLARLFIEKKCVACAQIDGPTRSFYHWKGKVEETQEYRLTLKFSSANKEDVHKCLLDNHPYDTPQWLVVEAVYADPAYLDWATQQ